MIEREIKDVHIFTLMECGTRYGCILFLYTTRDARIQIEFDGISKKRKEREKGNNCSVIYAWKNTTNTTNERKKERANN